MKFTAMAPVADGDWQGLVWGRSGQYKAMPTGSAAAHGWDAPAIKRRGCEKWLTLSGATRNREHGKSARTKASNRLCSVRVPSAANGSQPIKFVHTVVTTAGGRFGRLKKREVLLSAKRGHEVS